MTILGVALLTLLTFAVLSGFIIACAPRSSTAVLRRDCRILFNLVRSLIVARWVGIRNGIQGLSIFSPASTEESYEQLCQRYATTLPAFSGETKRVMEREGILEESSTKEPKSYNPRIVRRITEREEIDLSTKSAIRTRFRYTTRYEPISSDDISSIFVEDSD